MDAGRPLDGRSPGDGAGEIRHTLIPSPSSSAAGRAGGRTGTGAVTGTGTGTGAGTGSGEGDEDAAMDFNYFEEEYQVQLALAISASSSIPEEESRMVNDPESLQIQAAKRISLGHFPSPSPATSPVEFLAHRYWSYNVIDYDEKVIDGFYDVYGILSDPNSQGMMPSLVDLKRTLVSDNVGYEVVLVNRIIDPVLQQLEQKALGIALECGAAELGPLDSGLLQRIADLVAENMGGPVTDADDMLTKWTVISYKLRTTLNNIVLPLGRLQIGLSRHRALLFKVLADCVGIPCRVVKGSHYTGTDDGAVNMIKLDNEREFIIDLMGAPGTLIPTETPSVASIHNPVIDNLGTGQHILAQAVQNLCSTLEEKDTHRSTDRKEAAFVCINDYGGDYGREDKKLNFESATSSPLESSMNDVKLKEGHHCESIEPEFGILNPPSNQPRISPSWTEGVVSVAEKRKVKSVSQYVMNAASENPEFAQRLHAVLLESGVPAPPHLFAAISSQDCAGGQKVSQQKNIIEEREINDFLKRQDKISLGPGRPPKPIMREKSLICNSVVNKKSQLELVEGTRLKRVPEAGALDNTSLMEISTSQAVRIPIAGIQDISNTHISSIPSPGMAASSQHTEIHRNLPVVTATTKCNNLNEAPGNVDITLDTSMSLANKKNVGVNNATLLNLMGREYAHNRGEGETFESESQVVGLVDSRGNSEDESVALTDTHNTHPIMDDVAECEIRLEYLQIGERIGLGSYGEVYHADWNGTEVAVKKFLDQDFSGDALEQFRSEVRIMRRLRHPNIVLFMGAVTRPPNLSILTEFLPRGSLYRLIHRPNLPIDEKRRLRMALDVAQGMNYLHSSNPVIVHRDLKSPNLLVDKNWVVKVCDFGLSRLKHHTFLSSKSTAGTPEWMAPEVLRNEPSNEKCDVFSFGVILWELATLRMPWSGMNPMQVVGAVGFQNRRLDIPKEIDPEAAKIISECWQNDPNLRPSFGQLMVSLKSLQRLLISPQ